MCILKSIGGSFSQRLSFLIQPIDERFDMPHFYSGAWYSKVVTQPESQCDGVICVRREFEVVWLLRRKFTGLAVGGLWSSICTSCEQQCVQENNPAAKILKTRVSSPCKGIYRASAYRCTGLEIQMEIQLVCGAGENWTEVWFALAGHTHTHLENHQAGTVLRDDLRASTRG